jgi:hypothetical protein
LYTSWSKAGDRPAAGAAVVLLVFPDRDDRLDAAPAQVNVVGFGGVCLVAHRPARPGTGPAGAAAGDPDLVRQQDELRAVAVLAGGVAWPPAAASQSAPCLRFPAGHHHRVRHSNFIERTFGETRRRTKVIGRLPGETSCLTLVWAVLDRASRGWRGLAMTSGGLRLLQDLRRSLLEPPPRLRPRTASQAQAGEQPATVASAGTRFAS